MREKGESVYEIIKQNTQLCVPGLKLRAYATCAAWLQSGLFHLDF